MDDYIIPPNNIELEQSLLNACILYGDDSAYEILIPKDFYRTTHQKIFRTLLDLHSKQEPVDVVSATYGIDNKSYIAEILDAPLPGKVEYTANKLRKLSQLRRMIEISNAITKRCYGADFNDVEGVIDFAQSEMLKVGIATTGKFKHLADIMFECVERCEELQDKGGITGVPTGYIDLDALLCGFQGGDLILLAGRPSMGKTALMNCAAVNAAERGFPSAICQLEMTNIQTGNRLLALNGKVNSMKFRSGKFSNEDWFKIQSTASKLSGYKIYVDDSAVSNYQEIQKKARYAVKNYDIKILFIDYLGFIDGEKDQGKVNEIQTISRGLKATAKELNIPVILLCQLNRSLEQRPNKRPILSDLRDSGALEQDADVVLFIYRDEVYNKESEFQGVAEINVAKQRNGPTGIIRLAWLPAFTKFENLVREP